MYFSDFPMTERARKKYAALNSIDKVRFESAFYSLSRLGDEEIVGLFSAAIEFQAKEIDLLVLKFDEMIGSFQINGTGSTVLCDFALCEQFDERPHLDS